MADSKTQYENLEKQLQSKLGKVKYRAFLINNKLNGKTCSQLENEGKYDILVPFLEDHLKKLSVQPKKENDIKNDTKNDIKSKREEVLNENIKRLQSHNVPDEVIDDFKNAVLNEMQYKQRGVYKFVNKDFSLSLDPKLQEKGFSEFEKNVTDAANVLIKDAAEAEKNAQAINEYNKLLDELKNKNRNEYMKFLKETYKGKSMQNWEILGRYDLLKEAISEKLNLMKNDDNTSPKKMIKINPAAMKKARAMASCIRLTGTINFKPRSEEEKYIISVIHDCIVKNSFGFNSLFPKSINFNDKLTTNSGELKKVRLGSSFKKDFHDHFKKFIKAN